MSETSDRHPLQQPISMAQLFLAFSTMALTSFGGGISGWVYREMVERRHWISERDFLTGLSLAQAMPGVNIVNLSLWIGFRLRGVRGASAAVSGMLAGPFIVIVALGSCYETWGHEVSVHRVLIGVAAAGIGFSLNMGVKITRRAARDFISAATIAVIFLTVGILRWPLLPIIIIMVPLSIGWAFLKGSQSDAE